MVELNDNESVYDSGVSPINITWDKSEDKSLYYLGTAYFESASSIAEVILNSERDNIKCDSWFLPCVYLFRHRLELTLKALVARTVEHKNLYKTFSDTKHNLTDALNLYISNSSFKHITSQEEKWISDYLLELETSDGASDLFRYPFCETFLKK